MSAFPREFHLLIFGEEIHVKEKKTKYRALWAEPPACFAGCREGPRPVGTRRRHSLLVGTGGELRALHVYMCVLARVFTCNEHSGLMSRLWAPAGGGGGGGGGAEGSVGLRVANKDDQSRFRYSPPCINHGGA